MKSIVKTNINIDVNTGALVLIDMLFQQKLINEKTYRNIQEKYAKDKNIKRNCKIGENDL